MDQSNGRMSSRSGFFCPGPWIKGKGHELVGLDERGIHARLFYTGDKQNLGVVGFMGSFDFTCCVSGLSIGAGDDVRYLLLTEHPFHKPAEHTCYIHDRWIPRTFPLKAEYNDYGSVENVQEGLAQDIWFDGFKLDLVERGPGDNTCHDVPVRKDMGLGQMLEALWEGRVLVHQRGGRRLTKKERKAIPKSKRKVHKGIPTMKRVRRIIEKAGLPLSDGDFKEGYMVSVQTRGFIRVRWEEFQNNEENLLKLRPLLSERFATMITVGTGSYADKAEMIVAPKPLPDPERYEISFKYKGISHRKVHVAQAMIREDVWQAILSMEFKSWRKETPTNVEGFRKAAREFWDELKAIDAIEDVHAQVMRRMDLDLVRSKNVVAAWTKNEFVEGLGTHFELMRQKNPNEDDLRDFLNTVGEMAFVQHVLSQIRYQWRPSDGSGPQIGEWKLHEEFCKKMKEVAADEVDRRTEDGYYEDETTTESEDPQPSE